MRRGRNRANNEWVLGKSTVKCVLASRQASSTTRGRIDQNKKKRKYSRLGLDETPARSTRVRRGANNIKRQRKGTGQHLNFGCSVEFSFWSIYRGIFQSRGKVSIGASVAVARLKRGPCKGAKP